MNSLFSIVYLIAHKIHAVILYIKRRGQRSLLAACGSDTHIENGCNMNWENVYLGNDVHIGENNRFMCTRAPIRIGDHVMFGPNVTLITGNHKVDVIGKYMTEVRNECKDEKDDSPIILIGDNWVGANVTILKGVIIGEGAIIAAGSLVNKNVEPYSIVGGVPAKPIGTRFSEKELAEHKRLLSLR